MQLLTGQPRLLETLVREINTDLAEACLQILEAAPSCRGGYALPDYYDCEAIQPVRAVD